MSEELIRLMRGCASGSSDYCMSCKFRGRIRCYDVPMDAAADEMERLTKEPKGTNKMNPKEIVRQYVDEHLNKGKEKPDYEVIEVGGCYILGYEKWLFTTDIADGMYYELTYNAAKKEYYLDAYKRWENRVIREAELYE